MPPRSRTQPGQGPSQRFARLLTTENRPTESQVGPNPTSDTSMVARQRAATASREPKPNKSQQVVTQPVSFKPPISVKSKQAWRYPNFKVLRADSIYINERGPYTDPKEEGAGTTEGLPRRKIESNFFITINPNKKVPALRNAEVTQKFKVALEKCANESVLYTYIKFGPVDAAHYGADRAEDVIKSLDWDSAIEVGDEKERMHCHIWLTVVHYSQIQINVKMMQATFRRFYNEQFQLGDAMAISSMPYLQVKMLPQSDWTQVMRQYIKKAIGNSPLPPQFEEHADRSAIAAEV